MKTVKIFLILFLLVSIISRAQLMVQDNGLRQVETTIAIHPTDPGIMAIAAIELLVNTSGRQSVIWVSTNNGTSWTQKKIVDNAADPVLDFDQNGNLFFSYLERSEEEIYIIKSTDLGENWTDPQNVSNTPPFYKADKEWITVNKFNNEIYLVWIENRFGGPSKLIFAKSSDGGNQFSKSEIYSITGNTLTAPYIVTGDDGTIYISCTVLKGYTTEFATFDIIFTKSTDTGSTFDPFTTVIDSDLKAPGFDNFQRSEHNYVLKFEETNEARSFRIFPNTSMDVSNFNGNIYIVVNHREVKTLSPGITNTDYSDLVLYRSTDNGLNWVKKSILVWEDDDYQNDADQFFPSITSDENGNVFCLFYNSLIEGSTKIL